MNRKHTLSLIAAAAAALAGAAAHAKPPEIFPLSNVRRGQRGYGLSTFSGTEPTRWEFEVIGVLRNFRPKMDVILVKSDDPKMQDSGFWRGMSGSPLFIDGKLACAFSYAFTFNKKPIGACTPIEYMIAEGLHAPVRARRDGRAGRQARAAPRWIAPAAAADDDWRAIAPDGSVQAALASLGAPRAPWLLSAPLPPAPSVSTRPDPADPEGIVPAAIPLAIGGLTGPAYERAKDLFAPYPVEPMRAAGAGRADDGPRSFRLGSPISVLLSRGDVSMAATGTVSYVDGDKVLAFGHPFFEQGEFYAPVTAAEVHVVIPSQVSAFVIASPLRELGSLVQDRLPAIMADTSLRNRMIPMSVLVEADAGGTRQRGELHVELLNNKFLTAPLAGLMAMNAISRFLPDRDHATVKMVSTVRVKGYDEPLSFVDYLHAPDGAGSVIGGARGLRVLVPLLFNPFAPVEIESIDIRASIQFAANYGNIEAIKLPAAELVPGERNHVDVVLEGYEGARYTQRIEFDVPERLAGSIVKLEVVPGDAAPVDAAPPKTLDDLVAALRKLLPGTVFAVTLYTAESGVAIDGKLIHDLPDSALDRLRTGSRTQRAAAYRPIYRTTAPSSRVINGGKSLLVKVADKADE
ncbi:MAG: hypothetical protein D6689_22560 [Deltaproteobacteria bacterium]|nr:MAG: hypothetical protein D6689_22560 [Deltaproteobacteria bacterium]